MELILLLLLFMGILFFIHKSRKANKTIQKERTATSLRAEALEEADRLKRDAGRLQREAAHKRQEVEQKRQELERKSQEMEQTLQEVQTLKKETETLKKDLVQPGKYRFVDKRRSDSIYILRSGDTNYYKIGISVDPFKRMKALQSGNPFELVLKHHLKVLDAQKVETKIHKRLKEHHIRGEWFELPYENVLSVVQCEIDSYEKTMDERKDS